MRSVFAARATASSPSGWKARMLDTGQRKSGAASDCPKTSVAVSTRLTSTRWRARICTRSKASRLARTVRSSFTPVAR